MVQGNDKRELEILYDRMYRAMIEKDRYTLDEIHTGDFTLTHMTGMVQSKREYIDSIMNGTLNYYDSNPDSLEIDVQGDSAQMRGKSRVLAAVFGGGKHTWRLALSLRAKKIDGQWVLNNAVASIY